MNFRLLRPTVVVDVSRLSELHGITRIGSTIRIGAATTHRDVELDEQLMTDCAVLADALPLIGHVAIRNAGTVGGSLAHADPAAEWGAIALLLDGQIDATGPGRTRTISADDFFTDWLTTALEDDEVLTSLSLELPGPGSGSAFVEVARRQGDYAMAGVGAVVQLDGGTIVSARVALLGLGLQPFRCRAAEEVLSGRIAIEEVVAEAAAAVFDAAEPIEDQHASAAYKRRVARVLAGRAIRRALERAGHHDG